MKFTFLILLFSFLIFSCSDENEIGNPIIGSWQLERWTAQKGDEAEFFPYGEEAFGRLAYLENGKMFLTLMKAERAKFPHGGLSSGTTEENEIAFKSYFHYTGTYEIQKDSGFVRHFVESCTNPNWEGITQTRFYKLTGNVLELKSPELKTAVSENKSAKHHLKWIRE